MYYNDDICAAKGCREYTVNCSKFCAHHRDLFALTRKRNKKQKQEQKAKMKKIQLAMNFCNTSRSGV